MDELVPSEPTSIILPIPPHIPKSRLVVRETIYFQGFQQQPKSIDISFNRLLEQEEQPYHRIFKVTEEWKPIDTGWITKCSMMVVENKTTPEVSGNLTEDQKVDLSSRIIEVGSKDLTVLVRVGHSSRFEPKDLSRWKIRCQKGTARCHLSLYPG